MYIRYKTKKRDEKEHVYSLIVRLEREDFTEEKIIREVILKIKVLSFLKWRPDDKIVKYSETIDGKECNVFEIRRKRYLYPEDMPFEIIGPKSNIGEILYSVTDENHSSYLKDEVLLWELYGEGISSKKGKKELRELQQF